LRAAFPGTQITLVGLPWARQFVARFGHLLDDFMEFPGYPGFGERECDLGALPDFFRAAQQRRFDLTLQMHGSGRLSNSLAVMLGAARTTGFIVPGDYFPDAERYVAWREGEHEILRYLRLMRELGVPARGAELEFPVSADDRAEWQRVADASQLGDGPFVCIHPGSQLPSRRWRAARFAQVGDALAADGFKVVLTGVSSEAAVTREVADAMRARPVDLAGRTSLGALGALVSAARLVVCNDTGISHIAAATGTRSVVVCCGADPHRFAPLDHHLHRVIYQPLECRPCTHVTCPFGHPCAEGVSAGDVISAARAMLEAQGRARTGPITTPSEPPCDR
jgi:ADP-heptose:LPS heptosyltransferase